MEDIQLERKNAYLLMKNDIQNGMVNHAYLLHGQNQNELNQIAILLAQQLNCKHTPPCKVCAVCSNISKGIFSDVLVFPKSGNSLKTEDANYIVGESFVTPFESEYKVFIINQFENATITAQNKLLKTLEEPTKNVVFILTTTNINAVLETIRSRSKKVLIENSKEISADKQRSLQDLALDVFLKMKKSSDVLKFSNLVLQNESVLPEFVENVQKVLVDATKINLNVTLPLDKTYEQNIKEICKDFNVKGLHKLFTQSIILLQQLKANVNKNACIENFLIKILEVRFECLAQV